MERPDARTTKAKSPKNTRVKASADVHLSFSKRFWQEFVLWSLLSNEIPLRVV
jgi:hypothetical protein